MAAQNDAPVIIEGASTTANMDEDGSPTAFNLTLNATEIDGDTLTWSINGAASNGTATTSGTGLSKAIGYTPNANFNGTDSFIVQINDGNGGTDTITINVSVAAQNDAPTISDLDVKAVEGMSRDIHFTGIDIDDDNLSFTVLTPPANGTIVTVRGTVMTYTPNAGFTGSDSFTVNCTDGTATSNSATIRITVTTPTTASVEQQSGTTVVDYRIRSLPLVPLNPNPLVMLGGQIGSYDPATMRIAAFNHETQQFIEYPFTGTDEFTEPGDAAWFLFRHAVTLNFLGADTPVVRGPFDEDGYFKDISGGWNLIGNPFKFEISVESILVQEGSSVAYLMRGNNHITQPVFWIWDGGDYRPASTLPPGTGGWILKLTPGHGQVFFSALPLTRSSEPQTKVDTTNLERPPAPPGEFIQPAAEESGGGGGCFIDAAAYDVSSLKKAPVFFISSLSAMLLGFWRLKKRYGK